MLAIRLLEQADIPQAMQLVAAAGWNQTARDWSRVIAYQPDGCFQAVNADRLVGTVTTTCYQRELAWIGMMLVDASERRQGIGTQLMQRAIDVLHNQQMRTIKLDATPAGRPLYQRLGFQAEHDFQRWMRPALGSNARSASSAANIDESFIDDTPPSFEVEQYAQLDRKAFGADRRQWLMRLAADSCVVCGRSAFGMLRPGRMASYMGPIVADDPRAARQVIEKLLSTASDPVIWDVPPANAAAAALAEQLEFQPVRVLTRMWLGEALTAEAPHAQFALCDPATG